MRLITYGVGVGQWLLPNMISSKNAANTARGTSIHVVAFFMAMG